MAEIFERIISRKKIAGHLFMTLFYSEDFFEFFGGWFGGLIWF
jgi:hypothetical protein